MEKHNIITLLDSYFEGNTSLQEEQSLKVYFNSPIVDEDLLIYQPLFQALEEERKVHLPEGFDQTIMDLIAERENVRPVKGQVRRLSNSWMLRAAAIVVLALGMAWMYYPTYNSGTETAAIDWSKYEPETPEEALQVYKQAMLKLGKALNEGANTAATNVKRIEEVGQFFE